MSCDFILVAGPLVRASSWEPTAQHLRAAGYKVGVPDVLARHHPPPAWRDWNDRIIEEADAGSTTVLVGHSSASALVADLATRLACRGLIIVDGDVPPAQGAAAPVRPALRDFIRSLAGPDGMLPVWSKWFAGDPQRAARVGIDLLARDATAFAAFEAELPLLPESWFDDTIELAAWDHVPAGFIRTSAVYDHATAEAKRRGWPVAHLHGTHLDPTLRPAEMAAALIAMSGKIGLARRT
jgi:hypothetical protein